jgi:hypothetical protein
MKYNIENNIDFYKQLYDSLNDNIVDDDAPEVQCELCLISNLPLVNNFIELKCGHKFNYGPLYKDIFNYKKKFNNMELKTKLKQNQLRCPYCRNVQDELLPFYENFGYPKEHGVNFFDVNKGNNDNTSFGIASHQCQYQIINFDSSGNAHTHQCNHYGYMHSILKTKYNNENKYCYNHRLILVKEIKEKEKNEKAKKIEEKNKLKLELMKQKMELKNKKNNCEHTINNNFCSVILKTGKQKGTQCSGKPYKVSLCKRHYNLQDKNNTNNTNNNTIINMKSEENEETEENIVIG